MAIQSTIMQVVMQDKRIKFPDRSEYTVSKDKIN